MTITPEEVYTLLLYHFGNQHWWPFDKKYHVQQGSDPRFEIMTGAILTQNTAWANVEKALHNLKKTKVVQKIEKKTNYAKIVKTIIHYVAIVLVPGYLTVAIFYYIGKLIKKLINYKL